MNRAARHILSVLILSLAGLPAWGQNVVAPVGAPVLPAAAPIGPTLAPRVPQFVALAAAEPIDAATMPGPVAQAVEAAPPPDPQLPQWGNYAQPPGVPMALPPLSYELVGPPRGIVQGDLPQTYTQVLGDPTVLQPTDDAMDQPIDLARPDGLAPIGVHGDHTLKAGRVLFSARYDQESFKGLFSGSSRVSTASVLGQFPFAPTQMFQNRATALFEYGATDDLTMLLMLPFQRSLLDYAEAGGGTFETRFTNPGDVSITALYALWRAPGQQLHLNFGMSFPVGFLDYLNIQPSPVVPNLPYVIRTSSGSYDLLPGLTYRGQNDSWTWGVQTIGTVHLGLNHLGYELGDSFDGTAWLARRWTCRWSTSVRLDGQVWGNVRGADPRLNTALSPTNDPGAQGGSRLNVLFGINYYLPAERVPGQILSIEAGAPVFQSLDGPQLGESWTLIGGWNLFF